MKLAAAFAGINQLCIDTAPFIYFVERNLQYIVLVREIFRMLDDGAFDAITSTVTLTEVLTKPIQVGDKRLTNNYRDLLLNTRNLRVDPMSVAVAEQAATLRARYSLRTPDAIQIATALNSGCHSFLTNDRKLLRVAELPVLVLDDLEL